MRLQKMFNGEDTTSEAAAIGDLMIEYASELSGSYLTHMLGAGFGSMRGVGGRAGKTIASKIKAGIAGSGLDKVAGAKAFGDTVGKTARRLLAGAAKTGETVRGAFDNSDFMKMITAHGYNGVIGEMLEERFGGFLRGLTGLDGDEYHSYIANVWNATIPKSTDQFMAELVAFSLPAAANAVGVQTSKVMAGRADPEYDRFVRIGNLTETARALRRKKTTNVPAPGKNAEGKKSESPIMEPTFDDVVESLVAIDRLHEAEQLRHKEGYGVFGWVLDAVNAAARKVAGMQYITSTDAESLGLQKSGWRSSGYGAAMRAGIVSMANESHASLESDLKTDPEYARLLEVAGRSQSQEAKQALRDRFDRLQRDQAIKTAVALQAYTGLMDLSSQFSPAEIEELQAGGMSTDEVKGLSERLEKLREDPAFLDTLEWDQAAKRVRFTPLALLTLDSPQLAKVLIRRNLTGFALDETSPVVREDVSGLLAALDMVLDADVDGSYQTGLDYAQRLRQYLSSKDGNANLLSLIVPELSPVLNPEMVRAGSSEAVGLQTGKEQLLELFDRLDPSGEARSRLHNVSRYTNPAFVSGALTFKAEELTPQDGVPTNPFQVVMSRLAGNDRNVDARTYATFMAINGFNPASASHRVDFEAGLRGVLTALELGSSPSELWRDKEVVARSRVDGRLKERIGVVSKIKRAKDGAVERVEVTFGQAPAEEFDPKDLSPRSDVIPYVNFAFGPGSLYTTRANARLRYPDQYNQIKDVDPVRPGVDEDGTPNKDKDLLRLAFGATVGPGGSITVNLFSSSHAVEDILESALRRYNEATGKKGDSPLRVPGFFLEKVRRVRAEFADRLKSANDNEESAGLADDPLYQAFKEVAGAEEERAMLFELYGKLYKRHRLSFKEEIDARGKPVFHALDKAADRLAALLGEEGTRQLLEEQHAFYLRFMSPEALAGLDYNYRIEQAVEAATPTGQKQRRVDYGPDAAVVYVERDAKGRVAQARPGRGRLVSKGMSGEKWGDAKIQNRLGTYETGFRSRPGSRSVLEVRDVNAAVKSAHGRATAAGKRYAEAQKKAEKTRGEARATLREEYEGLRRKRETLSAERKGAEETLARARADGDAAAESDATKKLVDVQIAYAKAGERLEQIVREEQRLDEEGDSDTDLAAAKLAYDAALQELTAAVAENERALRPLVLDESGAERDEVDDDIPMGDPPAPTRSVIPEGTTTVEQAEALAEAYSSRGEEVPEELSRFIDTLRAARESKPKPEQKPEPESKPEPSKKKKKKPPRVRGRWSKFDGEGGQATTSMLDSGEERLREAARRDGQQADELEARMRAFKGAPPDRPVDFSALDKMFESKTKQAPAKAMIDALELGPEATAA
ncbi:MAG TPA: hypothetical protein PK442_03080, partial [Synergistales bacterium]|nr:hypothetical protein [Synergistales bacterium]